MTGRLWLLFWASHIQALRLRLMRELETNLALDLDDSPQAIPPGGLTEWNPLAWPVAPGWRSLVGNFIASAQGRTLGAFIGARLAAGATIYPADPFRALALTPLVDVSVVIIGQDPYHGPGQAEGLSFSVAPCVKPPPSLRNIHNELQRDLGRKPPQDGSLARWGLQGVLLLNTCLTVEKNKPASHSGKGWEVLTDEIIKTVAANARPTVFILWGAHAQAKRGLLTATISPAGQSGGHLVLCANHPSPLAARRPPRPFIGCGHFRQANDFLRKHGLNSIDW